MKKLFVGNLPYTIGDSQLRDLFTAFGNVVSATVIMDRFSGRSKGFGFVEMEDAEAEEAIKKLDGSEVEGRKVVVNEARPREDRGGFGGGDRGQRKDFGRDRRGGGRY